MENTVCKYCGAPLEGEGKNGVIECRYCHRKHIIAKSTDANAEIGRASCRERV